MSRLIDELEQGLMKKDVPDFAPGDTVVVQVRVTEGERERQGFGAREQKHPGFIGRFDAARQLAERE